MKIKYKDWNPKSASLLMVEQAEEILDEYEADGYTLTLRQLYYQFVGRGIIEENSIRSYKNLGTLITKARMAGMISWRAIEDRNREHNTHYNEEDEISVIKTLPALISFDYWQRQENYVEVWVEKDALVNVVERACDPLQVSYMACKGYLSASEAWRAGMRFKKKISEGKRCTLIHLGDHDPSGMDMTRDNSDRLNLFTGMGWGVDVKRIALNMDQVYQYDPPPNPAKITDTRSKEYIENYGSESWELDALEPSVINQLIEEEVNELIDWDLWNETQEEEAEAKERFISLGQNWEEVKDFLDKGRTW